jgi:uncharacterized membrane protein (DUF373 family)
MTNAVRDGRRRYLLARWLRRDAPLAAVNIAEDAMHYLVAFFLLAAAVTVLFRAVTDFVDAGNPFAERVTDAVNGVLFVIIIMEILRTVMAHFDDAGLQLKPFLTIGIISAVRHILTIGAKASLGAESSPEAFRHTQIELGVNAAVVAALVIGLVLVRRTDRREEMDLAQGRSGA